MKIRIDLKSDTVTLPPDAMRQAMACAELGDDFYFEDPTVAQLEKKAAEMLGKEAALLVLSGTMGNLTSAMSQARPGSEAIFEADAHMFRSEAGGISRIAGVVPRRIPGQAGVLDPNIVETQITKRTVLNGGTSMICIEQTHNGAGGTLQPLENLAELRRIADKYGIKMHMDGARVFNAATALRVPVSQVVKDMDSVTFCLSKGLTCPLGAVVAGSREFIAEARYNRQVLGGGMRQAGVIAAAGIWALDNMVDRLAEDHENAKRLAELAIDAGFKVNMATVETNMVRINTEPFSSEEFRAALMEKGIEVLNAGVGVVRCVTHWGITKENIEETGLTMKALRRCR